MRPLLPLLFVLCLGCPTTVDADRTAVVGIDTEAVVATVPERYLSFAVDSSQVCGTGFWNEGEDWEEVPEVPIEPYDFGRERLANLTAELAPAWLRVGGTHADHVLYDMSGEADPEVVDPYEGAFTAPMWDGVGAFALDLDLQILFTLNAGSGPRDADDAWLPDQARALMQYTAETGYPVGIWELGNEPNAFAWEHGFTWSGEQFDADLAELQALRDELDPDGLVAAGSVAYWPVTGESVSTFERLMAGGGARLDLVTWHYYPQQSVRCPLQTRLAGPEVMLDPVNLDEVDIWADEVEGITAEHAPGVPVWLGETGNAQCGGAPGVSDTFAGGFWWLDQLGRLAARGQQGVVRQTLSGSDYGLMDDTTLTPRPDYWSSVLWRRLMGERVLDTWSDDPTVRVYAHCLRGGDGQVAVVAINLDTERSADVVLPILDGAPVTSWVLTSEELTSRAVLLNRELLTANEDGTLPPLDGFEGRSFFLPARSYGFATWEADAGSCR